MFKDQVMSDIDNVFINENEFADYHDVNGMKCLAVVSGNFSNSRGKKKIVDGLHGDYITVSLKEEVFIKNHQKLPPQGANFKLDGKIYVVDKCFNSFGVVTISLGVYRIGGGF